MRSPSLVPLCALIFAGCGAEVQARVDPDASAVDVFVPAPDLAPVEDVAAPEDIAPPKDIAPPPDVATANACEGRTGTPGDVVLHITSGGRDRQFRVHVPAGYVATRATPVVLNFHGWLESAATQDLQSGLSAASNARGFIAVHPQGEGNSWNAGACCTPASTTPLNDVQFVRDLLDRLERDYCVDPRRVFAMGFSNGAAMSHRLGCELSERIAAIGPVSGTLAIPTCAPRRPVAVLHTHGTGDLVVPYNGGAIGGFQSVAATLSTWGMRDRCTDGASESFRRGAAHCDTRRVCGDGAEVTLCTLDGGLHAWPVSADFNATQRILDFFERHPMP